MSPFWIWRPRAASTASTRPSVSAAISIVRAGSVCPYTEIMRVTGSAIRELICTRVTLSTLPTNSVTRPGVAVLAFSHQSGSYPRDDGRSHRHGQNPGPFGNQVADAHSLLSIFKLLFAATALPDSTPFFSMSPCSSMYWAIA